MIDAARGLSASEVAERVARGEVNRLPPSQTRTYSQIVRANVLTRFNALLGAMLVIILVVGPFQDSLFGFVLVANAAVGIVQEVRAKRTLERLTVLTAPKAHVIRDGEVHVIPVEEVVADEVLEVSLGGQVVVDGEVLASEGLEIDESLITGESDPVQKAPGDTVRSGSFAVAGTGRYRATAIGSDAYAVKLAEEARRFALTRSELRSGVDRILVWVTWAIVPTGALLFFSQLRSDHGWHESISGAVAGTVAMVPEGLVLLMSVAFAVAVVRLAQRRILVQELPAVEGLARVDVLCIDKTGTLTEGRLAVTSISPIDGVGPVEQALAAIASTDEHPNATLRAIAERFPEVPAGWTLTGAVAFSSGRKWSGAAFGDRGSWVLGGADVVLGSASPSDPVRAQVARDAEGGNRVVMLAKATGGLEGERLPSGLLPAAVVVLGDVLRARVGETLRYFEEQDVAVKVISGDDPRTVGAIAGRLGLRGADRPVDARTLAEDVAALGRRSRDRRSSVACRRPRSGRWFSRSRTAAIPSR